HPTSEIYSLSLHDALPILLDQRRVGLHPSAPLRVLAAGEERSDHHVFEVAVSDVVRVVPLRHVQLASRTLVVLEVSSSSGALDFRVCVRRVVQTTGVDYIRITPRREPRSVDAIRPGDVFPAPATKAGLHAAHGLKNMLLHVEHAAAGSVERSALGVPVDFDQVPAERQMRLRGLDVWLPPLVYDRVSVIVEQEDVIAVVQEFKALVLGPGDPDVLLESVGGLLNRDVASIVNNDDLRTGGPALNLMERLLESIGPVVG